MRILSVILTIIAFVGVAIPLSGCSSESDSTATPEHEVVTVQRGNLTIDITAAGNLALSRTEDLAIDLFYGKSGTAGTKGTVGEVLVEEGDSVKEGQVLVTVDKAEWEDELSALEDKVTSAERQVTSAERQLITKQQGLVQAEINLINAKTAMETAEAKYVWPEELFAARESVRAAERQVKEAQAMLRGEEAVYDSLTGALLYYKQLKTAYDLKYWTDKLADAEEKLRTCQVNLDALLAESAADTSVSDAEEKLTWYQGRLDTLLAQYDALAQEPTEREKAEVEEEIAIMRMKVELAQEELEDAQKAQEDVVIKKLQVEQNEASLVEAQNAIEDAQTAIGDAQKALEDAREELDEAKSKSPEIRATFDGFITMVNVEGGDEVMTGTTAVQLADPNKFEAEILVSEMDILQVTLGGAAWVEVDAMSGLSLPAEVTHISPTATIQSGVVNYRVKVEVKSLEAVIQEQQAARQDAMQAMTEKMEQGELPEQLKQAIEEGRLTQEQVEEMMKQRQQGEGGQQAQAQITTIQENFQLREGLTVTVSVIVNEATDVLLIPNGAITSQAGKSYVQVVSPDGTTEEREIQTGISDFQYTEVTDGLNEGEQIVVPQGTTITSPTQQQERPRGIMIPGMGRSR
ncbi:HlyD family efflux transporter periplasmic adaptor subunit [Chloroflexota bacterium]